MDPDPATTPDDIEPEAFIPYVLDDLVEMCLDDDGLPIDQRHPFREFSSFFSASTNFQSHQAMGQLDKDYSYFNPDSEMNLRPSTRIDREEAGGRVLSSFTEMATNANYRRLTEEEINASFDERSLIKLKTAVDLQAFAKLECWVRGGDKRPYKARNWRFQEVEVELDIWRRVLMLMQFKEDHELSEDQKKAKEKANLPYEPGKIYLYQYKDVPKPDLEILFPNVRVSMNNKDRAMLGVPAIAATIGTLVKLGPGIVLIVAAIIYSLGLVNKPLFGFDPDTNDSYKLAILGLTVLAGLGALFFKQYTSVKNKRIGFLKEVSEHLFFRNIAMNKSVIDGVIDDGEEEDCKEALLVYYHILSNPNQPMNRQQLDTRIQDWMRQKFDTVIDFDIDGPVEKLKQFTGSTSTGIIKPLLNEGPNGILTVPSLTEAKQILDDHWDKAFDYSEEGDSMI